MGGSAMAGSLVADGWPPLALPVLVHRDEGLPDWVGPDTLVVAASYSGDTAETLAAVAAARRRGCPLVAITSGGGLRGLAAGGTGGAGFPAVIMPGGQPPRTALGASLGALLHVLHRLGLTPDPGPAIVAAAAQLRRDQLVADRDGQVLGDVAARDLAKGLAGRFTVIYTSGRDAHGAGRRLLAQLNENAKAPGHVACFPELDHNEIVGWNLTAADRDRFSLVVLRGDPDDGPANRRVDVTLDLLRDQFAASHEYVAWGADSLSRRLGLIQFGDLASAHVAVATGTDPVPIARIDALKQRLTDR
jgi:glucose/mannose-6-phosphate isomerase